MIDPVYLFWYIKLVSLIIKLIRPIKQFAGKEDEKEKP